ncbi:MAG: 50S ribosomal protein L23 [Thiotrichaceae bacterium]
MNEERMYHVIRGPHVTEKAALQAENSNMQVFKVDITATKSEIKKSIETLFEVDVTKVRTIKVKGKTKNFGRRSGKRNDWKKAYVTLAEGQSIGADQNP